MTYPAWKQTDLPEEDGRGYLFRACSGEGARQPLSLGVWQRLKGRQGSGTLYSGKRKGSRVLWLEVVDMGTLEGG